MAFSDFPEQQDVVRLLQRSLERGRLGHAYLFGGTDLEELGAVARTLAKALSCEEPPRRAPNGMPLESCDRCRSCRNIDQESHADVLWVRPESKSRIITIDQIRDLLQTVHLKPTQARLKVAIIVAADRLNPQAANAFLKTLEEPPADSTLILLSTQPERILETIISRCLRLNFAGEAGAHRDPAFIEWIAKFSAMAAAQQKSLLSRYRLLSVILGQLNRMKEAVKESLTKRSPLERYEDIDPKLREKWEDELDAAIEAEYRRQRTDLLTGLQWWFRDVWLETMKLGHELFTFPQFASEIQAVAARITPDQGLANLDFLEQTQRLLSSNVQEALALEVGLLKLKL